MRQEIESHLLLEGFLEDLKQLDDRVPYGHMAEWWRDHISSPLKVFQKGERSKTDIERMEERQAALGFSPTLQGQWTIEIIYSNVFLFWVYLFPLRRKHTIPVQFYITCEISSSSTFRNQSFG